jgi:uncharacterized protein (DUF952 family)
MAAPQHIYHIATRSDWDSMKNSNEYSIETLEKEGFIHCSKWEQLAATIKRFFLDRTDIVLLKIDTKRLNAPLIYEAAADGSGFFPHAFGPININSIIQILEYPFNFNPIPPEIKVE